MRRIHAFEIGIKSAKQTVANRTEIQSAQVLPHAEQYYDEDEIYGHRENAGNRPKSGEDFKAFVRGFRFRCGRRRRLNRCVGGNRFILRRFGFWQTIDWGFCLRSMSNGSPPILGCWLGFIIGLRHTTSYETILILGQLFMNYLILTETA